MQQRKQMLTTQTNTHATMQTNTHSAKRWKITVSAPN